MNLLRFLIGWDNGKVGEGTPNIYSPRATCPVDCPLHNLCYPNSIWSKRAWDLHLPRNGISIGDLCNAIRDKFSSMWRYATAGDLPGNGKRINANMLRMIVSANKGKRGYTYTHYPVHETSNVSVEDASHNLKWIRYANDNGFTISLSANNPEEAVGLLRFGLPVVSIVPAYMLQSFMYKGIRFVPCPSMTKGIHCNRCGVCTRNCRNYILTFPAHGNGAKTISETIAYKGIPVKELQRQKAKWFRGYGTKALKTMLERRRVS